MRRLSHLENSFMAKAIRDELPRREREIMNALFALGNRATAEEIRVRLADPPSGSSVRVMLTRLERKGYVRHSEDGIRYVYSATESPHKAKKTALQRHLQTFFGGSLAQMVVSLVRQGSWTEKELEELAAEIQRARKEKSQ
jgi:BlaI family transcriptional regulator, penicillinase repressor